VENLVGDTGDFSVVFYTMKIMFYIRCYLTEMSKVMNCDANALNAFSHPVMINATLFIDDCKNTAIKILFSPITLDRYCSNAS